VKQMYQQNIIVERVVLITIELDNNLNSACDSRFRREIWNYHLHVRCYATFSSDTLTCLVIPQP